MASNRDTVVGFLHKLARSLRAGVLFVVVLSLPIIVGLAAAYVFGDGTRRECVDSCHPAVSTFIRGECHCAVEGGWMVPLREQEKEEVKD